VSGGCWKLIQQQEHLHWDGSGFDVFMGEAWQTVRHAGGPGLDGSQPPARGESVE